MRPIALMGYRGQAASSASGIVAAWGLKRINPAYAGPLIRVRRAGDDAESDIGQAGGQLDTAALSDFVGQASAYVVKIYDQYGVNPLAQISTPYQQPRIVNAGTYLGYVEFNGSNDILISPTNIGLLSTRSVSVFARLQRAGNGSGPTDTIFSIPVGSDGYVGANGGFALYYDPRSNVAVPNLCAALHGAQGNNISAFSGGTLASMCNVSAIIDTSKLDGQKARVWVDGSALPFVGYAFNLAASVTEPLADQAFGIGGIAGAHTRLNFRSAIVCRGDQSSARADIEAML